MYFLLTVRPAYCFSFHICNLFFYRRIEQNVHPAGLTFSTVSQGGYGEEEPDPQADVEVESDDTGDGDDTVTGVASSATGEAVGIFNNGVIDGGAGDDVFDALTGGWGGNGRADLGSGNDTVRGFGSGTFDGGVGFDTLVFNAGTYNIARVGSQLDRFEITLSSLQNSPVMTVTEFEFFGEGDQQTSFAAAASAGEITFV